VLTLDTSGVVALLNRAERNHLRVAASFREDGGPYLVPCAVMLEVDRVVTRELGRRSFDAFMSNLESGAFRLDCGKEDLPRVRALMTRYANLSLDVANASVIACAERNGGRVLTTDQRDFAIIAREGTITPVPGW
jgi:predicted nucleic acid-binding protein